MREKVRLKTEYKQLVRAGNLQKAQKVLERIWNLCGIKKTIDSKDIATKENKRVTPKKKYSKKELEKLSFKELKKIGYSLGTTDRSKKNLIKEILQRQ